MAEKITRVCYYGVKITSPKTQNVELGTGEIRIIRFEYPKEVINDIYDLTDLGDNPKMEKIYLNTSKAVITTIPVQSIIEKAKEHNKPLIKCCKEDYEKFLAQCEKEVEEGECLRVTYEDEGLEYVISPDLKQALKYVQSLDSV